MRKQSLTDLIAADNKDKNDETAAKRAAEETKATAEGDLSNTVKDLADTQTCCGHLHPRCDHLRRCKCPTSWLVWTRRTAMLVMRRSPSVASWCLELKHPSNTSSYRDQGAQDHPRGGCPEDVQFLAVLIQDVPRVSRRTWHSQSPRA